MRFYVIEGTFLYGLPGGYMGGLANYRRGTFEFIPNTAVFGAVFKSLLAETARGARLKLDNLEKLTEQYNGIVVYPALPLGEGTEDMSPVGIIRREKEACSAVPLTEFVARRTQHCRPATSLIAAAGIARSRYDGVALRGMLYTYVGRSGRYAFALHGVDVAGTRLELGAKTAVGWGKARVVEVVEPEVPRRGDYYVLLGHMPPSVAEHVGLKPVKARLSLWRLYLLLTDAFYRVGMHEAEEMVYAPTTCFEYDGDTFKLISEVKQVLDNIKVFRGAAEARRGEAELARLKLSATASALIPARRETCRGAGL